MNGKGSKPRPLSVSREEYERNWDMLFGKKEKTESCEEPKTNGKVEPKDK